MSKDSKQTTPTTGGGGGSNGLLVIDAYYTKLSFDAISERRNKPNYAKLIAAIEHKTATKFKYTYFIDSSPRPALASHLALVEQLKKAGVVVVTNAKYRPAANDVTELNGAAVDVGMAIAITTHLRRGSDVDRIVVVAGDDTCVAPALHAAANSDVPVWVLSARATINADLRSVAGGNRFIELEDVAGACSDPKPKSPVTPVIVRKKPPHPPPQPAPVEAKVLFNAGGGEADATEEDASGETAAAEEEPAPVVEKVKPRPPPPRPSTTQPPPPPPVKGAATTASGKERRCNKCGTAAKTAITRACPRPGCAGTCVDVVTPTAASQAAAATVAAPAARGRAATTLAAGSKSTFAFPPPAKPAAAAAGGTPEKDKPSDVAPPPGAVGAGTARRKSVTFIDEVKPSVAGKPELSSPKSDDGADESPSAAAGGDDKPKPRPPPPRPAGAAAKPADDSADAAAGDDDDEVIDLDNPLANKIKAHVDSDKPRRKSVEPSPAATAAAAAAAEAAEKDAKAEDGKAGDAAPAKKTSSKHPLYGGGAPASADEKKSATLEAPKSDKKSDDSEAKSLTLPAARQAGVTRAGNKSGPISGDAMDPRSVVREGPLQLKTGSLFKSWSTFHFKLTPESLQYYKKATDKEREGVILIVNMKGINILSDNKRIGRRFDISVGAKNQIYGLLTETKEECDKWIEALKGLLSRHSNTSIISTGPKKPVPAASPPAKKPEAKQPPIIKAGAATPVSSGGKDLKAGDGKVLVNASVVAGQSGLAAAAAAGAGRLRSSTTSALPSKSAVPEPAKIESWDAFEVVALENHEPKDGTNELSFKAFTVLQVIGHRADNADIWIGKSPEGKQGEVRATMVSSVMDTCTSNTDYTPAHAEELPLSKGGKILVIDKRDDGWWYGIRTEVQAMGYFDPLQTSAAAAATAAAAALAEAGTDGAGDATAAAASTGDATAAAVEDTAPVADGTPAGDDE